MTDTTTSPAPAPKSLVPTAPAEVVQALRVADIFQATATELIVDSPMMFDQAAGELVKVRARWNAVEAQRVHLKAPFLEGCQRIDAFFREPLDRLQAIGETLKASMLTYTKAEEARVAEAQRLERERQQAERAELERQQAEAARQAQAARDEAARIQREADERARQAREQAEAQAAAARASGDEAKAAAAEAEAAEAQRLADEEAERARQVALEAEQAAVTVAEDVQQAMDLADVAPAAVALQSGAKARGVATRKAWKLINVDKRALVLGVAAKIAAGDEAWLEFLEVNESALTKLAGALKGATRVDGCVFGEVASIASTGRGR